jgi:hypothetical protein
MVHHIMLMRIFVDSRLSNSQLLPPQLHRPPVHVDVVPALFLVTNLAFPLTAVSDSEAEHPAIITLHDIHRLVLLYNVT